MTDPLVPETVRLEMQPDGIAHVLLDRPAANNALDQSMVRGLVHVLERLRADPAVRGLVLRGRGKHFCAGIDLGWMSVPDDVDRGRLAEDTRLIQSLYDGLHAFPRPTIAVVQGAAVAAGLGLASTCDAVIAHADAFFSASEVKIGIIPGMLLPYLAARVGEGAARQVAVLGLRYSAEDMRISGLVTRIARDEAHAGEVLRDMSNAILATSPDAVQAVKELCAAGPCGELRTALPRALEAMVQSRLSPSAREGLQAAAARRKPSWDTAARG